MDKKDDMTGRFDAMKPTLTSSDGELESEFAPSKVDIKAAPMQLVVHKKDLGKWVTTRPQVSKKLLKIGAPAPQSENDIIVRAPNLDQCQAILVAVKYKWHLIECGKTPFIKINGIQRRQIAIRSGDAISVEIGSVKMVINNTGDKSSPPPPPDPQTPGFVIRTDGGERRVAFTDSLSIGEDSSCSIIAKGQPFHGIITSYETTPYLVPLADGSFKSGEDAVNELLQLKDNDIITVGDTRLTISIPPAEGVGSVGAIPEKTNPKFRLWLIDENGAVAEKLQLPGPGASIYIGRSHECNLVIEGKGLSRKHAQMIMYDSSVLLLDCYSTNGTYVNGMRISKKTVRPGDIIQFGEIAYMLVYAD